MRPLIVTVFHDKSGREHEFPLSKTNQFMKIGIFGGSFDPIHNGHLILAEHCREQAQLDEVWFVPVGISPAKQQGATATGRQRLEMLQMSILGNSSFRVSSSEVDRQGLSYTVDTLTEMRQSQPQDEFRLIMGADSLESFGNWKDPQQICELATPLVVRRPGASLDLEILKPFLPKATNIDQGLVCDSPLIEISSSEIRRRIREEASVRYLTPRSVEMYILNSELYRREED